MTGPFVTPPAHDRGEDGGAVTSPADLAAAQAVWRELIDELLRGIAHALSNRVATVSAAAYLASSGEPLDATMRAALAAESERLEGLLGDLRLLPGPLDASIEPVLVGDVVPTAISLHRHHVALRSVPIEVTVAPDAPPAAINPTAVLHLLLVVFTALRLVARGDALVADSDGQVPTVELVIRGEGDAVVVQGTVRGPAVPGRQAAAVAARYASACDLLARPHGGRATADAPLTGLTLRIPSLMAHRARAGR